MLSGPVSSRLSVRNLFHAEIRIMRPAANIMRDCIKAARDSYLPCPNWCSESAGSSDFFIAIKLKKEESISKSESAAEESTESEPVIKPTAAFETARQKATHMAIFAAFALLLFVSIFLALTVILPN